MESAVAALPAEGMASFVSPSSFALEVAIANPRALKLPVGSRDSSLTHNALSPNRSPSRLAGTSGVVDSPKDTIFAGSITGSSSA